MKKIIAALFIMLVSISCLGGSNTHQVEAAKYKTIKFSSKTIPEKVKKYANYNKYTKYTVAINYYLDQFEKAGGGTLIIKKGTYDISNAIYIPSNVTVILKDGVTLRNINNTGNAGYPPSSSIFMTCPRSKSKTKDSVGKYNGSKNVVIKGEGNATIDNLYFEGGGTIVVAHATNVTVSGITFKNQNGGHFIEVSGVKNATFTNNIFKNAKKSTRKKYYCKEAINIDTADANTHGLNALWVKKDKTPNKNILIQDNVFDGVTRGVGTHKYSQKNGKNVYHTKIKVVNNTFKNIYDNGVFILNWSKTIIKNNKFSKIGLSNTMSYSSGAHAIAGGGITGITITNNTFNKIKRNPIYFCVQKNVGAGSQYSKIKTSITKQEEELMMNNTAVDCGDDMNSIFAGYHVVYFKGSSERTKKNMVGINFSTKEIVGLE